MSYAGETVSRAVYTHLQAAFAAARDVIAAQWAQVASLDIPAPVTWFYGHNPVILELPSVAFPFVSVVTPGTDPVADSVHTQTGYGEQTVTVYVDFFVVADTVNVVNVLVQRYAAALYEALLTRRNYEGYLREQYAFPVSISEAVRHSKTENADLYTADLDFFQGGRITLTLRGD